MIAGTGMFIATGLTSSVFPITIGGLTIPMYEAVASLILNLVLSIVLTPIFEAIGARRGQDSTSPTDYEEEYAPVGVAESGKEALG